MSVLCLNCRHTLSVSTVCYSSLSIISVNCLFLGLASFFVLFSFHPFSCTKFHFLSFYFSLHVLFFLSRSNPVMFDILFSVIISQCHIYRSGRLICDTTYWVLIEFIVSDARLIEMCLFPKFTIALSVDGVHLPLLYTRPTGLTTDAVCVHRDSVRLENKKREWDSPVCEQISGLFLILTCHMASEDFV